MSTARAPLALLALACALLSWPTRAEEERARVLLFPLGGALGDDDKRALGGALAEELGSFPAVELLPADARDAHMQAAEAMGVSCSPAIDLACVREVAALAGARYAVHGDSSLEGGVGRFRLELYDTAAEESARATEGSLPPPGEPLSLVVRAALLDLLPRELVGRAPAAPETATVTTTTATATTTTTSATAAEADEELALLPLALWVGGGAAAAGGAVAVAGGVGTWLYGVSQPPLRPSATEDEKEARRRQNGALEVSAWALGAAGIALLATGAAVAIVPLFLGE